MTTTNDDIVKGILAGGAEALAHVRGEEVPGLRVHAPETVNARRARKAVELSQREFAALFGLSTQTVRAWEQGTRKPNAAARMLLRLIAREPEAALRAVRAEQQAQSAYTAE